MRLIINVWCGESRTSPPPETTRLTSTVGCSELSANTVGSPGHVCLRGAQEAQLRAHHQHGGDRLRDATVRGDACFEESMSGRALHSDAHARVVGRRAIRSMNAAKDPV